MEFIGTLQKSRFWRAKVYIVSTPQQFCGTLTEPLARAEIGFPAGQGCSADLAIGSSSKEF